MSISYAANFYCNLNCLFYLTDDATEYLERWAAPILELKKYSWASLRQIPAWKDIEEAMTQLNSQSMYDADTNAAQLHKEYGYVKSYCTDSKIKYWNDEKISGTQRWVEIFKHLDKESCDYKEIAKIIEYILCLPGSTAPVERVFSAMNKTWTDEKSNLKVETLKAILTTKVNLKMTCINFFQWIKEQPDLLRKIHSREKYKLRTIHGTENIENDPDEDCIDSEVESMVVDENIDE